MDRFSEYVRSATFRIDLSQGMIEALVSLREKDGSFHSAATWRALHRRGLVDAYGLSMRHISLTGPGHMVTDLLEYVGLVKFTQPVITKGELRKYSITYGYGDDTETVEEMANSEDEAMDLGFNYMESAGYYDKIVVKAELVESEAEQV